MLMPYNVKLKNKTMLPDNIKNSLDEYAKNRCPTGGFLHAVLCNDLFLAMGKADEYNVNNLFDICNYIYNNIPNTSWGSKEIVATWLEGKTKLKVTQADIGRWVEYLPKKEIGRLKSFNEEIIYVVYHCDNNWDRYTNYTAAGARYCDIRFLDEGVLPENVGDWLKGKG